MEPLFQGVCRHVETAFLSVAVGTQRISAQKSIMQCSEDSSHLFSTAVCDLVTKHKVVPQMPVWAWLGFKN